MQFFPDILPWPQGVVEFEPTGDYYLDFDRYGVQGADGLYEYVEEGDWIVTDEKGQRHVESGG